METRTPRLGIPAVSCRHRTQRRSTTRTRRDGDRRRSVTEHLEELRNRIITSLIALGVGTLIAFLLNEWILDVLARPYQVAVPDGDLALFRPTEAFSLVMRLSSFGGLIIASPVILYQLWRFVAPSPTTREKRWTLTSVFVAVLQISGLVGY